MFTDGVVAFTIYPSTLASYFDNLWPFPLLCSLLAYFCRAEGTIYKTEFLAEKDKSLAKELAAAMFYETIEQKLDYTGLLGVTNHHLHHQLPGSIGWRLVSLFNNGIRHITQQFSSTSARPLLPKYNSRKNVSRATCRWYQEAIGAELIASDPPTNVTTLDLLKLYYHTGLEAQGEMEMRQAWFFNDLKPRTYYCMGGADFFHGMYIQDLANLFVQFLPSSNPFSRYTVERIGSLSYDDLLVTYDYTSFTTSLGELQFFMFWLAESVGDVEVDVLDVFRGLTTVKLRDILHTYNDSVNRHQMFSIERFQQMEEYCTLRQGRNGSLGTKGNIVLSTKLHALALADITGTPDDDCCVGDDAAAKIRAWLLAIFISCVNNLGTIHPEKFTTIRPIPPEEETSKLHDQFKFLKRPLNLDDNNVPTLGRLEFFPSVADALFPSGDGIHTVTPGYSPYKSAKTFAMQVGRFLRIHCNYEDFVIIARDSDMQCILDLFKEVYMKVGLPIEGGIPDGFVVGIGEQRRESDFFCPPVDTLDVFTIPWMELLLDRFYGHRVSLPVTCGGTIPPPLEVTVGEFFHASSDVQVLALAVDLGFLEKTIELRWESFTGSVCDEVWKKMIEGGHNTEPLYCRYDVVAPTPNWWYDVVSVDYPEFLEEDPLVAAERISSVTSSLL